VAVKVPDARICLGENGETPQVVLHGPNVTADASRGNELSLSHQIGIICMDRLANQLRRESCLFYLEKRMHECTDAYTFNQGIATSSLYPRQT